MSTPAVLLFPEVVSPGPVSNITGTVYTLTEADVGVYLRTTNAAPVAVTLANQAAGDFEAFATIWLQMGGAGPVTLVPGAGVTINSAGSLTLTAQYSLFQLKRTGLNEWTALKFGVVAAGATTFLQLTDTPANYAGAALYIVRVNAAATGLEFVDPAAVITNLQNLAAVGINTTANAGNRLSVKSPVVTFSAEYAADGGTGDMRLILNKELVTDFVGVDLRQGNLTMCRLSLDGDNNFRVRVSTDSVSFIDAIAIDQLSGSVDPLVGEVTIAGAATVDLGAVISMKVAISGAPTISSFGTSVRRLRFVRLTGTATIVHNAVTLICPGGVNIVGAVGDCFIVSSDPSGNWRIRQYTRAADGVDFVKRGGDTMTGALIINSGATMPLQLNSEGAASSLQITRASAVAGQGPNLLFRRAAGTLAALGQVLNGSVVMTLASASYNNGAAYGGNNVGVFGYAGQDQTTTAAGAYLTIETTPIGSVTRAEALRIGTDGALSMFVNVVIDANRIFRLRAYTFATLPAASTAAGAAVYCSDYVGGAGILISDGATWQGYQRYDADLAALAALAGTGIAVRTAADTWAQRSLAAPAAGFTITNPAGVAGNPTFVLANDLAAVEGLAGTGIAVRTAADTWAQRTITGTASQITVTDGAGVAANPTLSLDLVALDVRYVNTTGGDSMAGPFTVTGSGAANAIQGSLRVGGVASATSYADVSNAGTMTLRRDVAAGNAALAIFNYGILAANQGAGFEWYFGTGGVLGALAGTVTVSATDTWALAANQSSKLSLATTNAGSPSSKLEIGPDGALTQNGGVIFDVNRIFRPRVYTIATLPTPTPSGHISCSDLGGGQGDLRSNGTNWVRSDDGAYSGVSSDVDYNLTVLVAAVQHRNTATLTANRTINLLTTNAYSGARFKITRTGAGAFNLSVGGLKNLAQNTWCEVVYDGAAWYLAEYGTL